MSESMRVALVTETFPPEVNGVARTLRELVGGLCARGHELDVVRPRQDRRVEHHADAAWRQALTTGVPIPFYPGLRFGLPAYRTLRRRWSETRPDVVHIATEGPLGLAALEAARRLGVPVASSFHTNFHQYGRFYGYGALMRVAVGYLRWFHNRTRRTLVPTHDVRTALEGEGFERIDLLARGVDTDLFDPSRRSDVLRREWGAGPDDPVVVFVSRLAQEKSPELALRGFIALRERWPAVRCVVVGDGPAAASMRRQDPDAIFCGMRRGEDLATHYASADAMLFPSRTETFGNVVTEAMASGLATVSFDYAASRALVEHEVDGFKVPFDAGADAFVDEVLRLEARGLDIVREVGRRARLTAEGQTWAKIVERFEDVLIEVSNEAPTEGHGTAATHGSATQGSATQGSATHGSAANGSSS